MTLRKVLSIITIAGFILAPGLAFSGKSKLTTELLSASDDGRWITFKDGGKEIKSKVSGSRTTVTIKGSESDRENLAAGMTCEIEYKKGGKNEPTYLDCK